MSGVPQIDVATARAEQAAGALLLDVREQDEWDAGHVAGALHIPMSELQERFVELPEADATLVICRSGSRSDAVAARARPDRPAGLRERRRRHAGVGRRGAADGARRTGACCNARAQPLV